MTALDQADIADVVVADRFGENPVHPGARGMTSMRARIVSRAPVAAFSIFDRQRRPHWRAETTRGARHDPRAAVGGVARVQHHKASIVDQPSEYFERFGEEALQRCACGIARHVERLRRRQKLAAAYVIVKKEAEADQPGRPRPPLWKGSTKRIGQMTCGAIAQRTSRLHQGFAHQAEFIMLEIAQAAMDELGRAGGCSGGEIAHLRKRDGISTASRITRDAASVDAPPMTEDVEYRLL